MLFFALTACIIHYAINTTAKNVSQEKFKIGAIVPLTGAVAADGEEALLGMKIAVEELDREMPNKFSLIIKDGKFEPKESLSAFNALVAEKVDAVMSVGDVSCQMIQPLLAKNEIIAMAPMASSLSSINQSEWIFRSWVSIEKSSKIIARYIRENNIAKRAAVFYIDTMYGSESDSAFEGMFEKMGGLVVAREVFPFLATDLRGQIAKLLSARPEIIYVTGFGPAYIVAINQLRECGYDGILALDAAIVDPRVKKNIKRLDNIIYVGTAFADEMACNEDAKLFAAAYKMKTGKESHDIPPQAPFSYFAIKVVAKCLVQREEGAQRRQMLASMIKGDSLLGQFSFTAGGELKLPIYVKSFENDGSEKTIDKNLWRCDD